MNNNYLKTKDEFVAIDILKFVAALLVVSIHVPPFYDYNFDISFWMKNVLSAIAVPFLFVSSGYFCAEKMQNKGKFILYLKRMFKLYVIYSILYFPQVISDYIINKKSVIYTIISLLRRFFITGYYYQLWYFVGLIVSVSILYFFVNCWKLSDKKIIIIAIGLYFIGVCGNSYKNLFMNIPFISTFIKFYLKIFITTKNGIFCGLFFVVVGYLIKKYDFNIKNKRYGIYTLLFFIVYNMEAYVASVVSNKGEQDLLFSTAFITISVFLFVCFANISESYLKYGKFLRKLSVLIFGLHMFVYFYIELFFDRVLKICIDSLVMYGGVVIITIIVSSGIIYLSNFEKLKCLRNMY